MKSSSGKSRFSRPAISAGADLEATVEVGAAHQREPIDQGHAVIRSRCRGEDGADGLVGVVPSRPRDDSFQKPGVQPLCGRRAAPRRARVNTSVRTTVERGISASQMGPPLLMAAARSAAGWEPPRAERTCIRRKSHEVHDRPPALVVLGLSQQMSRQLWPGWALCCLPPHSPAGRRECPRPATWGEAAGVGSVLTLGRDKPPVSRFPDNEPRGRRRVNVR